MIAPQVNGSQIDLGAMLLVGLNGNPLTTLCQQAGCRLHALDRGVCPLYDGASTLDAALDARAEAKFNELMSTAADQR